MTKKRVIEIIGVLRYGNTEELIYRIGKNNFEYILKNNFIYQGIQHPEIWRITEKGITRSKAISSKPARLIAYIFWKLNTISTRF